MNLLFDSWRDVLEIAFFAFLFYHTSMWLKKDTTRNLLPYFYGVLTLGLTAHVCALPTVSYFLFLFAPSAVALFILLHQDTLERNIVALKNITATQAPSKDWVEIFIQVCLSRMNENKTILCVIENQDSLAPFLECAVPLHATVNQSIFNLVLDSPQYDTDKMLWILSDGIVQGANVAWIQPRTTPTSYKNSWEYDAQLYTSKTDCVVLHVNPLQRSFTLIHQGLISENIPAATIASHLGQYLSNRPVAPKKKGVLHVIPQTYFARQRTP